MMIEEVLYIQALRKFYDVLTVIGESWVLNHKCLIEFKHENQGDTKTLSLLQLGDRVLAKLDYMILIAREMLPVRDEDGKKSNGSLINSKFGDLLDECHPDTKSSNCRSPGTPTSVLPEFNQIFDEDENKSHGSSRNSEFGDLLDECYYDTKTSSCLPPLAPTSVFPQFNQTFADSSYSPPRLGPLRLQAVGKLKPMNVKCLSFHMFPKVPSHIPSPENDKVSEVEPEKKRARSSSGTLEASDRNVESKDAMIEKCASTELPSMLPEISSPDPRKQPTLPVNINVPQPQQMPQLVLPMDESRPGLVAPLMVSPKMSRVPPPPPPPPPLPVSQTKASTKTQPPVKKATAFTPPLPPPVPPPPSLPTPQTKASTATPPPMKKTNTLTPPPSPPPPPPPTLPSKGSAPPPPPPPIMRPNIGSAALPPPPPMLPSNGTPMRPLSNVPGVPPPPPGAARPLRPKKANTKLKRSSYIANLYRALKEKIEGNNQEGKRSSGKRNIGASSGGSKQSMADALAEMTKRSSYFQQIEEDVKNHSKTIVQMISEINSFQAANMDELKKFHQHVESHLEKLTDETQVLARFEDFPTKKLESLRTAAALYAKLNTMLTTLNTWKLDPPVGALLDRVETYFNKIKGEVDAQDRTKDEESKRFQSHKITFDFHILVQIKESMVDLSSSCMELALKERGEAEATRDGVTGSKSEKRFEGCTKMLWRAFQLAFRVYTFAGGHDDRADTLTRELAHEIENDPQQH